MSKKAYRKKPVVIEAIQLTPTLTGGELDAFLDADKPQTRKEGSALVIRTLEGWMTANLGDWIIRGVKGELYPCKADLTYEAVDA